MRFFLYILLLFSTTVFAQVTEDDVDGDGLLNTQEDVNNNGQVDEGETNPLNADTDGGGEADGKEISAGRDPLDRRDDYTYDLDNDGLPNGEEYILGTEIANPDTDGDGINDFDDPFPLDSQYRSDFDNDGLPDEFEQEYGLSTDDANDADADNDGDGLSNREEFIEGTNPSESDTDRDGTLDGLEVEAGDDPLENACLLYTNPSTTFTDIAEHWGSSYILSLHNTKTLPNYTRIIDGFGGGPQRPFRPEQNISRFELLKIALMSSCIPLAEDYDQIAASFEDISTTPRPYEHPDKELRRRVIYTAVQYGIVQGYPDNTFRPDDPVNRAEAVKMLLLASGVTPPEGYYINMSFPDVPAGTWFYSHVDSAFQLDLIEGYPDRTFKPEKPITRAEAAKIVYFLMISNPRVNGYDIPVEETLE